MRLRIREVREIKEIREPRKNISYVERSLNNIKRMTPEETAAALERMTQLFIKTFPEYDNEGVEAK